MDLTFLKCNVMHTFFLISWNSLDHIFDIELVCDGRVGDVFVLSWLSSALLVWRMREEGTKHLPTSSSSFPGFSLLPSIRCFLVICLFFGFQKSLKIEWSQIFFIKCVFHVVLASSNVCFVLSKLKCEVKDESLNNQ